MDGRAKRDDSAGCLSVPLQRERQPVAVHDARARRKQGLTMCVVIARGTHKYPAAADACMHATITKRLGVKTGGGGGEREGRHSVKKSQLACRQTFQNWILLHEQPRHLLPVQRKSYLMGSFYMRIVSHLYAEEHLCSRRPASWALDPSG